MDDEQKVQISPEMRQIPEYRKLIERDKDRNKRLAMQELAFVWFTCNHKSPYVLNTAENERTAKVAKDLRLDVSWKPDADVVYAQARYNLQQKTVSTDTLVSVKEGLFTSNKLITVLRGQIDEALKDVKALASNPQALALAVEQLEHVLKLSIAVPKMIDTITTLEDKIKKEQSNNKVRMKGGGEKGSYED